jgi:hypothetical protein
MSSEIIIEEVRDFLDEYYKEPKDYYKIKKNMSKDMVYYRVSCDLVCDRLRDNPNKDPILVITDYRDIVDGYCCDTIKMVEQYDLDKDCDAYNIFLCLYTVLSNVLDFLYAMQ